MRAYQVSVDVYTFGGFYVYICLPAKSSIILSSYNRPPCEVPPCPSCFVPTVASPRNVPSRTTLACSLVKALSGIFHSPAGDSPAIYPCNLGKHSRSSSRSRLFQYPDQHSARFPHAFLMLRLYGCAYFPTGHTLLKGIRSFLRRLSSTPSSSQSLKSSEFCVGVWVLWSNSSPGTTLAYRPY
jgi:hypothetical protein